MVKRMRKLEIILTTKTYFLLGIIYRPIIASKFHVQSVDSINVDLKNPAMNRLISAVNMRNVHYLQKNFWGFKEEGEIVADDTLFGETCLSKLET